MCGGERVAVEGSAIVAALAERDRLDARIAEAVGAFDAAKLWDLDGATSLTAWLRDLGGRTGKDAGRIGSRARVLRQLPVTAAAFRSGLLGGGQVEAILARLRPGSRSRFAEHEAELVGVLAPLSVTDVATAMGIWAARAEAEGDDPEPSAPERSLHASRTLDDRLVLDGDLDADTANTVEAALRLATRADDEDEVRTPATRRADALGDLCDFFLTHQQTRRGGRHRPHVSAIVSLEDLEAGRGGRTAEGRAVSAAELGAMACDGALHRLVLRGRSSILDYGAATRSVPPNL